MRAGARGEVSSAGTPRHSTGDKQERWQPWDSGEAVPWSPSWSCGGMARVTRALQGMATSSSEETGEGGEVEGWLWISGRLSTPWKSRLMMIKSSAWG